jgi:gliding motility-associated-like protein
LEKNVTLRLTVTNKNNCISRDSLDITVVQALKDIMPNAFSPNTDGLNEGFGLPDIFEIQEFYVYDRWGGIVFKGNASNPRWDGNIGGVAAPAGSYSYSIVATLKGGTQAMQYSGKVSLIK